MIKLATIIHGVCTMANRRAKKDSQSRFGIGEWFGRSYALLSDAERKELNTRRKVRGTKKRAQPGFECPFRTRPDKTEYCNKDSAVCTIRLFNQDVNGAVSVAPDPVGMLRTTCPSRFLEDDVIFNWVGEALLGCNKPQLLKEVPYLTPVPTEGAAIAGFSAAADESSEDQDGEESSEGDGSSSNGKGVGSIDFVLVHPENPASWCALELQAVYFSGAGMDKDFKIIESATSDDIPFPGGNRRPDYRSSGPKRLMPQLQTKVPSLRRWGKKLAVVIDKWFWASLGQMEKVDHVSNGDIAWFVVEYDEDLGKPMLTRYGVFFTTLEAAIEGLTAGEPVSLPTFEARIKAKIDEQKAQEEKEAGLAPAQLMVFDLDIPEFPG